MTIQRTTLKAAADDLQVLKQEARRRGQPLGSLLQEMVEREAARIRSGRRPRIGVVNQPVSIAVAMDDLPDEPSATAFRAD